MILLRERERDPGEESPCIERFKEPSHLCQIPMISQVWLGFGKKEVAHDLGKRAVSRWWRQNQTRVN